MNDFNNIETDPIPEGLEFNESYMQSAFALYDAEKNKRKRRLIIWWITSALGFSCVLLAGFYFFTPKEASADSGKNAPTEKQAPVQRTADSGLDSETKTGDRVQLSERKNTQNVPSSRKDRSSMQVKNTSSLVTPSTQGKMNLSKTKPNGTWRSRKETQKRQLPKTARNHSESMNGSPTPDDARITPNLPLGTLIPEESTKTQANRDSGLQVPVVELPLRPAALAYTPDSTFRLPVNEPHNLVQEEEIDLRKHHVFLNLGVNTLFGMTELKNRVTFRESIGVSYTYRINPKLTIGTGLEYHSISRISYKRIIGDTANSAKTTTILNKTTLNYISFLPQVQYQLWPKHRLSAGFGIEYLLTDPGERYQIQNYTQEDYKRSSSKLYYSTFNRFNFSVSLGYAYQLSRYMSLQASYHYGFTDITINNSFNQTFDRNSRLYVGLAIKLR